jgi:hypothetical protein
MNNNVADRLKTHLYTLSATNYTGNTFTEWPLNSETTVPVHA